ncbi:MAG: DUF1501 domain-containing protein [Pirellulaceae bacterium]|nr:DUF1501 domain-containing protein [Pirellulaceae bacterium]
MLTVFDPPERSNKLCDGISRRNFLRIGALGATGLSLSQLLSLEAAAGIRGSTRSVILVYLVGGPPHQDLFDLKPDAPAEVAGPWRPIRTNVPGVEIGELLPMMSGMMDKFSVIRSLSDAQAGHDAIQCYTGRTRAGRVPAGGWPQFGSSVARLQGAATPATPPFVSVCYPCTHEPYNEPGPGYLGAAYTPFRPQGPTRDDMVLQGITTDRLRDREQLLASVDRFRREVDNSRMMEGLDAFTAQAMGVLTSSRLAEALDLSREDPRVVARYGTGDASKFMDGNGAPRVPQRFLAARRLVEAGARVVTVNYSKWDWHGGANNSIFKREQEDFPVFDQGITALVEDLHARGLAESTAVLVWGEFGRTPKISAQVGRDHWPRVACALLAGGRMRHGQLIGATDRLAGEPVDRPVKFQEVFATLYEHLGIDVERTTIADLHGRPQYLVETGVRPIAELV